MAECGTATLSVQDVLRPNKQDGALLLLHDGGNTCLAFDDEDDGALNLSPCEKSMDLVSIAALSVEEIARELKKGKKPKKDKTKKKDKGKSKEKDKDKDKKKKKKGNKGKKKKKKKGKKNK